MKPMRDRCSVAPEDLTALAMGALSDLERVALQAHLVDCPICQEELKQVRSLCLQVGELPRLSASRALRQKIRRGVALEREALRLSTGDRFKLLAGFLLSTVRQSKSARFFLYAAAAQVIVLLSLVFAFDLVVQKTRWEMPFLAMEGTVLDGQDLPSEENLLEYPDPGEADSDAAGSRQIEPPNLVLTHPVITVSEADLAFPLEALDKRLEKENRINLGRYRMGARLNATCKARVRNGKGGDVKTARAVDRGLKWLRSQQNQDGSWNPNGLHGGDARTTPGITSLAVAAFLSDGHSDLNGTFSDTVHNGLSWLIANQDQQGRFGWVEDSPEITLFNQSTTVLALAENYILTEGTKEEALSRGIEGLIAMLSPEDELPAAGAYSDTWAAMALRTSVIAGMEVEGLRETTLASMEKIALLAQEESRPAVAIQASLPPVYNASEVAITALFPEREVFEPEQPLGEDERPFPDPNKPETIFSLLDEPDFREPSFLFFIGTALCGNRDPLWDEWNVRLKPILLEEQDRNGLWLAHGDWPWIDGGDLYTTALHLLTLQVYYRYIKLEENCP